MDVDMLMRINDVFFAVYVVTLMVAVIKTRGNVVERILPLFKTLLVSVTLGGVAIMTFMGIVGVAVHADTKYWDTLGSVASLFVAMIVSTLITYALTKYVNGIPSVGRTLFITAVVVSAIIGGGVGYLIGKHVVAPLLVDSYFSNQLPDCVMEEEALGIKKSYCVYDVVHVDKGTIYSVPNDYKLWRVHGEVCHVSSIVHAQVSDVVNIRKYNILIVPLNDTTAVVCDKVFETETYPYNQFGGTYYAMKPSTLYVSPNFPEKSGAINQAIAIIVLLTTAFSATFASRVFAFLWNE